MTGHFSHLGAVEIARQIRKRQITPLEAVEACISRIEQVNPEINALVTPMFDQARSEASKACETLARQPGDLPPLFGVPVTIKDAFPVAGIRCTAGSLLYKDHIAREDAEAVRRLKNAGAVILGKTNCADMSGSTETSNLVFGLTRNPWNLAHSAGGSSGGEAALITSGGSPLGLGSDIAGSVRLPAAFCGIVSLKPTAGRVPTLGHIPPTPDAIAGWNTTGPLARRFEDLALALSVLSDTPVRDYRAINLVNRRVLVPEFYSILPVRHDVAGAIEVAAEALSGCGLQVVKRLKAPLLKVSFEFAAVMYREWLPPYRLILGNGKPAKVIPELVANLRGKSQVSPSTLAILAMVSIMGPVLHRMGYGTMERLVKLRSHILDLMGPGGLMLWPVFPTPAPRHGFAWSLIGSPAYTSISNCLGMPSVVVPIKLSKEKLPLAVQVIARPGEDEVALAVAARLEVEFGGWQPPPISF